MYQQRRGKVVAFEFIGGQYRNERGKYHSAKGVHKSDPEIPPKSLVALADPPGLAQGSLSDLPAGPSILGVADHANRREHQNPDRPQRAGKGKLRLDHALGAHRCMIHEPGRYDTSDQERGGTPSADATCCGASMRGGIVGANDSRGRRACDVLEQGSESEQNQKQERIAGQRHRKAGSRAHQTWDYDERHLATLRHHPSQIEHEEHADAGDGHLQRHLPARAS